MESTPTASRILITGGGTVEPIDAVRVITNLSTGRLALDLAMALQAQGAQVEVLLGRLATAPIPAGAPSVTRFGPARELHGLLETRLRSGRWDAIVHAAAVADYAPVPLDGKLSSEPDTLTLTLRRQEKLIDQLSRWAPGTIRIGFKLLAGASPEALEAAARRLLERAALHMVVGNDMRDIEAGRHRLTLVPRTGPLILIDRETGLGELAAAILRLVIPPDQSRTGPGPGP